MKFIKKVDEHNIVRMPKLIKAVADAFGIEEYSPTGDETKWNVVIDGENGILNLADCSVVFGKNDIRFLFNDSLDPVDLADCLDSTVAVWGEDESGNAVVYAE